MATPILLPKLGNTVESCIIETWYKQIGDQVSIGELLCTVETDKATVEVESTTDGVVIALHAHEGDEVEVLALIATIGDPNEADSISTASAEEAASTTPASTSKAISPRAKKLANQYNIGYGDITGSGPNERVIERDIQAAISQTTAPQSTPAAMSRPEMTPVAKRMVQSGEFDAPQQGSGPKGRVMRRDLGPLLNSAAAEKSTKTPKFEVIPVKGARHVIAERMRHAVHNTAPVTLHRHSDARRMKQYRQRLKESAPALGIRNITLTDLLLFATVRTLTEERTLNAHFMSDADGKSEIRQFVDVDLGFAVDTPRGLLVPVIRAAQTLSLQQLSAEAKRLIDACNSGRITPDELSGGTFTVSNLGTFGIDTFTPILNPPQVGILGVGAISLKPIDVDSTVGFVPHIGLSLTVDHQAIDGAPAARFLETLTRNLGNIDLLSA